MDKILFYLIFFANTFKIEEFNKNSILWKYLKIIELIFLSISNKYLKLLDVNSFLKILLSKSKYIRSLDIFFINDK